MVAGLSRGCCLPAPRCGRKSARAAPPRRLPWPAESVPRTGPGGTACLGGERGGDEGREPQVRLASGPSTRAAFPQLWAGRHLPRHPWDTLPESGGRDGRGVTALPARRCPHTSKQASRRGSGGGGCGLPLRLSRRRPYFSKAAKPLSRGGDPALRPQREREETLLCVDGEARNWK